MYLLLTYIFQGDEIYVTLRHQAQACSKKNRQIPLTTVCQAASSPTNEIDEQCETNPYDIPLY